MTPHTTRRLAAWAARCADAVLGPRCRYGCGQRIFPKDRDRHEAVDHRGDRL